MAKSAAARALETLTIEVSRSGMSEYVDLDDVEGSLYGPMVGCAKTAKHLFRTSTARACSFASDHGAVNLWIDDNNFYRGSLCVNWIVRKSCKTADLKTLIRWANQAEEACRGLRLVGAVEDIKLLDESIMP